MVHSALRSVSVVWCAVVLSALAASPAHAQRKKPKKAATSTAPAPASQSPAATATKYPPKAPAKAAKAPPPPAKQETTEPTPAAPVEEQAKVEAAPEAHPEADTGAARVQGGTMLEVGLGVHGFQRHLRYSGDSTHTLPPYDLGGAPAGVLTVGFYPYRTKMLSIGLIGGFEYAFAIASSFKEPQAGQASGNFTTRASRYSVGPQANLFLGVHTLGLAVEYGGQSYSVDLPPPTAAQPGVPDVAYSFIRPALSGRFVITPKISLRAALGYLIVLKSGEIISDSYFVSSRSSASAFDASLGGAYEVAPHIEVRLAFDYRRYALTFSPIQGDPYIASGATDSYLGATLGAAYRM